MYFIILYFLFSQILWVKSFSDITLSSIINIISLPTEYEQQAYAQNFTWNRERVISNILDYNVYTDSDPPEGTVSVSALLYIDKLGILNETEESMNFHGSFLFSWKDDRLTWKPRDYGGVEMVDLYQQDAGRIWLPQLRLLNVQNFFRDLITPYTASFTIRKDGRVFAITKASPKVYCTFYLSKYPYDTQYCTMRLYAPKRFSSEMEFDEKPLIWENHNGKPRRITRLETTGFALVAANCTKKASSVYRPPSPMADSTDPKITQSYVDYFFTFKRTTTPYNIMFIWPMTCTILFTHVAASFNNTMYAMIWLMASVCFQYLNSSRLLNLLPPHHDEEPFCLEFSRLMMLNTIGLFFCRIFLHIFEIKSKLRERMLKTGKDKQLITIEISENLEGGNIIVEKTNNVVNYLQNNYYIPKRLLQIFLIFYTLLLLFYVHIKHHM
uniref:Neur_chan_LBD domain-containing protein n=1 Tax=Parastrongyloides trichosuri TaxID=131310 RepID=A0A0N4Z507_PARTI